MQTFGFLCLALGTRNTCIGRNGPFGGVLNTGPLKMKYGRKNPRMEDYIQNHGIDELNICHNTNPWGNHQIKDI